MSDLRGKILAKRDLKETVVHIEEWDTDLIIRSLTGQQRADLVKVIAKTDDKAALIDVFPDLLLWCVCDPETSEPVFQPGDEKTLMDEHDGNLLDKLVTAALDVSGLSKEASTEAERTFS